MITDGNTTNDDDANKEYQFKTSSSCVPLSRPVQNETRASLYSTSIALLINSAARNYKY
jgi:hypothetical protein